jgi:hypothetical protein
MILPPNFLPFSSLEAPDVANLLIGLLLVNLIIPFVIQLIGVTRDLISLLNYLPHDHFISINHLIALNNISHMFSISISHNIVLHISTHLKLYLFNLALQLLMPGT